MAIDVGQTLDKYELKELVGQGGMAVVYRGLDTSLRREVAVKVLHRHLAGSQEARDRFEREAQAVAKLRHENILEIFDFSGLDSDESYIVTEFIDGQTLREFINDHELKYPQVGAMIAVQVCRALVHAHGLGVLHRDIKPENIMIRNDGVVKLTDFGIAQMLDHQRLTVTGQLLGSPAYMSPEHVEGKQLDFRTDVFAVGVVLYQLITGELPFEGSNPHEVLKRIAEGRYTPPERVNPLIGRELAGIVKRALAREKDDRYPDVSEMLTALEQYLEGCGLEDHRDELARFFESAVSYEMALKPRLVDVFTRGGRDQLQSDPGAALELFNRVLTIDPSNEEVLKLVDQLSRRQAWRRWAAIGGGALLVGAGALLLLPLVQGANNSHDGASGTYGALSTPDAGAEDASPEDAGADTTGAGIAVNLEDASAPPPADASPAAPLDAATATIGEPRRPVRRDAGSPPPVRPKDAGPTSPPDAGTGALRTFTLRVSPKDSQFRLNNGAWTAISGTVTQFTVPPGPARVTARNSRCCSDKRLDIPAAREGGELEITLDFLPATIVPTCDVPGARVRIDNRSGRLGQPNTIVLKGTMGRRKVRLEFFGRDTDTGADFYEDQEVTVTYAAQNIPVSCR